MKKIFFISFFVLTLLNSFGQIPNGYYDSAEGLTGTQLQSALHNIIKNHWVINYDNLWSYFSLTDKKANGKVWDMYSDNPSGSTPYEFVFSTDQCGSYDSENDCYNREHSWPQSWFGESSPMVSDLFHVYPTDGYVNNIRANYPFGEVNNPSKTTLNGSKLGPCVSPGYSGTVFEPIDDFKGDFARTYFYMSTRYYGEDSGWPGSAMTDGANLKEWALDMMIEWHKADTVSQKEIDRNNKVYTYQHNRNPFIDHPEYVADIWTSSIEEINDDKIKIYPNPANDNLFIKYNVSSTSFDFSIFNILGQKMLSDNDLDNDGKLEINISSFEKGIYFLIVTSEKTPKYRKIVIE